MHALNQQQQQIVEHLDGPALVIAGAGSGKTRVIIHRAARLVERGVNPASILLVTFTNKAAAEMTRRLDSLLAAQGERGRVLSGTFHSMANRFLRRHAPLVGFQHNYTILDDGDARDMIKAAMAETVNKAEGQFPTAAVVQSLFSLVFNRKLSLETLVKEEYFWLMDDLEALLAVHKAYARKKQANNAVDFDDLLALWHRLLTENPRLELTQGLQYLMVDEYQDTNLPQAEIADMLAGQRKNLMVVGDDAQSIYSWRGAHVQNILSFPQRFGGVVYRLEENYRSTPQILHLANFIISRNEQRLEKELRATRPASVIPRLTHVYDMREEAERIIQRIVELQDQDLPLNEMGVLYRNHAQSAELQIHLAERGIPFIVRSGIKFFEAAHIKDILTFVRVVHNPLDEMAWLRLLKMVPGIGNATAAKIYRVFADQQAVRLSQANLDLVRHIPAKSREGWQKLAQTFKDMLGEQTSPRDLIAQAHHGFYRDYLFLNFDNPRDREADIQVLAEFAGKYPSVERFLEEMALVGASILPDHQQEEDENQDRLTLSTIHQAKGLEWRAVFVMGLVEGQFPHAKCLEPPERLEEERRLFYVAVTRAGEFLEITTPLLSFTYGRLEVCRPSRFVEELPQNLLEVVKSETHQEFVPYRTAAAFTVE